MIDDPLAPPRRIKRSLFVVGIGVVMVSLVAGMWYLHRKQAEQRTSLTPDPVMSNGTKRLDTKRLSYTPMRATLNGDGDKTAEALAALRAEQDRLRREQEAREEKYRQELEVLRKQLAEKSKPSTPPGPPAVKAIKRPELGFINHERTRDDVKEGTYELAPGATKLSCITETAINSDVPGVFTAKVTRGVWDSATGNHLLIPQGSTILGQYHSETLLFGNERVPTTSLTLALPNGRSVDLGHAPVTDQLGVNGLTGRVNSHWFRNIGAVLIMGVLRGGQQVVQTELAQQNGATVIVGGVASTSNQFAQQRLGRAIDSRPTIEVDAGQPCTVILVRPLSLQAHDAAR